MLRLAHRILSQEVFALDHNLPEDIRQRASAVMDATRKDLRVGMPIILADNIAEYVVQSDEKTSIIFSELPPAPPPFPSCFVEWQAPSIQRITTGEVLTAARSSILQVGCSVIHVPTPDLSRFTKFPPKEQARVTKAFFGVLCVTRRENGLVTPVGEYYLLVDKDGKLIRAPLWMYPYGDGHNGERHLEIITVAATFAFMACKNTKLSDATKEVGPSAKWCRRQRAPELKYHTIQIDPNHGAKPRAAGRTTEGDYSGRALHIRRGHFAHYTDDGVSRGRFGRMEFGTFWIEAHVCGSLEYGEVKSTYNVKALCNS